MATTRRPMEHVALIPALAAVCWLMPGLLLRADAQDHRLTAGPNARTSRLPALPSAMRTATFPSRSRRLDPTIAQRND
jgi:hypothetical protein